VRGVTFFQRIKTPFTEGPADEQARLQPRVRLVGELLQGRREDLGLDLDEIGAMLRIKSSYLAALEQGRSHDLPGPTYAIGFVRAYADFLGLDSEQVLARFKAEASGVTARPDLALPVPLGERSLPGGALVLVALILALCGYGIWYYLSTEERNRPERVAAVPASLQAPPSAPVLVPPPPPQTAAAVSNADSNPPERSGPGLYGAAASPPQAEPTPTAPPAMTATAVPPSSSPPAVLAATPPTPAVSAPPGPLSGPVPRNAVANPPPSPPAATPQQSGSQTVSATPAPTAAPPAAPAPTAAASPAHVSIRALADCWIQVRAGDQSIVFSRVLKSGEVYNVPARNGLSLRTGNAGALEISVDGKTAPSIGGIGALRRDVALDPSELAAGTAVHG
jgi:cytoskeleton protein RodZ